MADRLKYERLANTRPYEHISVTIDAEIPKFSDGKAVKLIVERVDKYVEAIRQRIQLEESLERAKREEAYAKERLEKPELYPCSDKEGIEKELAQIRSKIEVIQHQRDEWWDDSDSEEE
jgi:hypothetical protein